MQEEFQNVVSEVLLENKKKIFGVIFDSLLKEIIEAVIEHHVKICNKDPNYDTLATKDAIFEKMKTELDAVK